MMGKDTPSVIADPKKMQPIAITLTNFALRSIKGALANSADQDQTPQNAASYWGLHCLLKIW